MKKWIIAMSLIISGTLSANPKVLAFSGSIREQSVNKKLMIEAASIASETGANVQIINLKDFPTPFYNGDLEETEGMPSKAKELRSLMIQSDIILIASPEYNGSLSALLKNTIDCHHSVLDFSFDHPGVDGVGGDPPDDT